MDWKLLVFDLDGLLVNTEMMHWLAYDVACQRYGFRLNWPFEEYFYVASSSSSGIQMRLACEHKEQFEAISWSQFYETKQQALLDLLLKEPVPLMPGVEKLLTQVHLLGLQMACVTHSRTSFADRIRGQHTCLSYIQSWYTLETNDRPKPAPDGYLKAVFEAGILPEQAVGFEDSLRGVQAQVDAGITSVLITEDKKAREAVKAYPSVLVFSRIDEILYAEPFRSLFSSLPSQG